MADLKYTVLLMEDSPSDAGLVEALLAAAREAKFDVTCVDRLAAGIECLAERRFDVVLLDLGLPDSTGFETFHGVSRSAPSVPIVILSGFDDRDLAMRAVQKGAQDYLAKGEVDAPGLERAIRYAVERKGAEEQLRAEQRLLRRLLDLRERERQVIACDIHDELLQHVIGAQMVLSGETGRLASQGIDDLSELKTVQRQLLLAINEGRRIIGELRPMIIDEAGILAAIDYLVSERDGEGPPIVDFVHNVRFERLSPLIEGALFRIVQEALANVYRHGHAANAWIRVRQEDQWLHLEIEDDGIGFDPAQVPEERFGVRSIHERARLFGGRAVIESASGRGTRVRVEMPLTVTAELVNDSPYEGEEGEKH